MALTAHQAELLLHAVAAAELARERGEPFGSFAEAVESETKRLQGVHQHLGIEVGDLAEQVAAWSPTRTLAVVDACERLGVLSLRGVTEPMPTLLRAVGLLRGGLTGAAESRSGPHPRPWAVRRALH